jgi:hypothetical protein
MVRIRRKNSKVNVMAVDAEVTLLRILEPENKIKIKDQKIGRKQAKKSLFVVD